MYADLIFTHQLCLISLSPFPRRRLYTTFPRVYSSLTCMSASKFYWNMVLYITDLQALTQYAVVVHLLFLGYKEHSSTSGRHNEGRPLTSTVHFSTFHSEKPLLTIALPRISTTEERICSGIIAIHVMKAMQTAIYPIRHLWARILSSPWEL